MRIPVDIGAKWRHRATCRSEEPELFFPIGTSGPALVQIDDAKAACRRFPVEAVCLRCALENGPTSGIWGATTEAERHALLVLPRPLLGQR
jgi:WhiB family redox-sensing transcriptional regulator